MPWPIGKKISEEHRRKLRLSKLGKVGALKGKPWTEARRKAQPPKKSVVKNNREYHPEWQKIRKEIYKLDKWMCQECGTHCQDKTYKKNKIQCHHIDHDIKNNNSSNLITLCASCHCKTGFTEIDWEKYFKNKMKYISLSRMSS